jgi:tetratricopeptide (TPR) repeat protein
MSDTATQHNDLRRRMQRALDHMNRGEAVQAEAILTQILAADPDEPDALQLLGLLRRGVARFAEAEELYRRSLALKPDQPQVHHNLANMLIHLGRVDEAIAEQRAAIAFKPNYAEAHLNLGQALQARGDLAEAEASIRAALRIQPNFAFAKQSLAIVLNELNRPKEAEALLRQALPAVARNPRQAAAIEHNLGVSLMLQQRHEEALAQFDSASAKAPDLSVIELKRGNILQQMGHFDEAANAYRRAIARNPIDISSHRELNNLLYRLGRNEDFLRSYDEAFARHPEAGILAFAKAMFLFRLERFDEARDGFERAIAIHPDSASALMGLGLTQARQGEFLSAIRAHESSVALDPGNASAWSNFAETLLRARDPKKALEAADRAIALDPLDQGALANWGLALRALDDTREEDLNDYERLVQVFELPPPDGFSDHASFHAALNSYLDRLHLDQREPFDQSLRGGTQTLDNIFGKGHDLIERLRARIDDAVMTYIARMKQDESHPLLRRRRAGFAYSGSWSSRLRDCGFHTNHVHPKGWISSAYYIALPDAVEDAVQKQGWLQFGEPAFDAGFKQPVRRAIKPVPGTLVLFPSYMWHGTVPFHAQAARTTIAFDAVPR